MSGISTPLKTGFTRVYIIPFGVGPTHEPDYHPELRAMAHSQGFGDVERIEVPDPAKLNSFVEAGQVRGATERPTNGLQGRYPAKTKSEIEVLAKIACPLDLQIAVGSCNDPRDYDSFDKLRVYQGAVLTNYSTDELGALASGDNSPVNESADISAQDTYEIVPVTYGVKAASILTNEVLGIVICDSVSCGDCENPSSGCEKIFAVTKSAGGSPSTKADIVYSIDKGVTWYAHDIESIGASEDPTDVGCLGSYIIVTSKDTPAVHYALKNEFDTFTDPAFTAVTTGFVAGRGPNAIWSLGNMAFIVGALGYIYKMTDPTAGVTVLDAGSVTTASLNDVHALSEEFAIAVGDTGAILYTANGLAWSMAPTSPVGFGVNLTCCWAKSTSEWWVGTSTGRLYFTLNAGKTWTEKPFSGSGAGVVYDIFFSTTMVGWISHSTATPKGRVLRTTNGGYSWKLTPEKTGILTANDRLTALAGCTSDPNMIVAGGLADDGADGFIAIGLG